ncbi:MAG TPA: 4Fe-4S binding protein, partial [Candidatus Omnitrophota bacterium]|nr:4Fe-4S binding protein [Candidatus Omnitrophota bacterium]
MKRKVIKIDEDQCNGCGNCIPGCPEGAIRIIDGKARLEKDSLCDGLGACLGECPLGAITIEEKETEAYDEKLVIENILKEGMSAVRSHLKHLNEHHEREYLKTALLVLKEKGVEVPEEAYKMENHHNGHQGCPGSRSMSFSPKSSATEGKGEREIPALSELSHWPVQLHLISPRAPHYFKSDLLL